MSTALQEPAASVVAVAAPGPAATSTPVRSQVTTTSMGVVGLCLTVLGALLLTFVLDVAVVGHLQHDRDQQTLYADLRFGLAQGTLPVGQTGAGGTLTPLGTPLALLEVPRTGLREVVVEGTTSGTLVKGPGHRRDSPLPGQPGLSVLLGRRAAYGAPFRGLGTLRSGDTLRVTTSQGVQQFRVLDVRRAGDPLPPPLAVGGSRLVLETASGSPYLPDGVLRVDADLTSPVQAAPRRSFGYASLPAAERELGSDTSSLVALVLWGQALVLAAVTFVWARLRWGRSQTWLAGLPVLVGLTLAVADSAARLLPNLL